MSEQHTRMQQYAEPISRLLAMDEASVRKSPWPDYPAMGLDASHVPELIRMAADSARYEADCPSAEVWAPVHAWRALGQLGAVEAVEPLLELLNEGAWEDDDWALEELPKVFALIGPPALRSLENFLDDRGRCTWARLAAAQGLVTIGNAHPDLRGACVAIIGRQLQTSRYNDKSFNGLLVGYLLDLKAVEAAELIEKAFADRYVDEFCAGDWPRVRYELGLGPEPRMDRDGMPKRFMATGADDAAPPPAMQRLADLTSPTTSQSRNRKRSKRKQARAAQKRNRK